MATVHQHFGAAEVVADIARLAGSAARLAGTRQRGQHWHTVVVRQLHVA